MRAGRCAAALAALAALGVASCSEEKPDPAKPSTYLGLCAAALTHVQFDTHQLEGTELVPTDPAVLKQGPPARVQCGISRGTYIGAVTFDALCADWKQPGCAKVTAAVMDGQLIYVSDEAKAELEAAMPKRRRHHHQN